MTMEKALGAILLLLTGQIIWAMQRGSGGTFPLDVFLLALASRCVSYNGGCPTPTHFTKIIPSNLYFA